MSGENLQAMVGERLAQVRRAKGLTQKELAGVVDCHPQSVSDWERGDSNMTLGRVSELAEALEVEPVEMLPVAGAGYRQGLKDARRLAETQYVTFKHEVSLLLDQTRGTEEPTPLGAPDGARESRGEEAG